MVEEICSIKANKMWEVTNLPTSYHPIGLKWVYKGKKDAHRHVVKHKAWLVAKGYVQKQRIDFDEVHSSCENGVGPPDPCSGYA
jgi:hypothetical protein